MNLNVCSVRFQVLLDFGVSQGMGEASPVHGKQRNAREGSLILVSESETLRPNPQSECQALSHGRESES